MSLSSPNIIPFNTTSGINNIPSLPHKVEFPHIPDTVIKNEVQSICYGHNVMSEDDFEDRGHPITISSEEDDIHTIPLFSLDQLKKAVQIAKNNARKQLYDELKKLDLLKDID